MTHIELRDRDELASFFRRRPEVHAYELGDLDDFFWPHTRWFGSAWVVVRVLVGGGWVGMVRGSYVG